MYLGCKQGATTASNINSCRLSYLLLVGHCLSLGLACCDRCCSIAQSLFYELLHLWWWVGFVAGAALRSPTLPPFPRTYFLPYRSPHRGRPLCVMEAPRPMLGPTGLKEVLEWEVKIANCNLEKWLEGGRVQGLRSYLIWGCCGVELDNLGLGRWCRCWPWRSGCCEIPTKGLGYWLRNSPQVWHW